MSDIIIGKENIGKIAERIVMNEFEARGYRSTDLNKDGLSANADLLVAKDGNTWLVQVKGAANSPDGSWGIQYGYCDQKLIDGSGPAFNRHPDAYYRASHVVFAAVRSPSQYRCFVMDVVTAEELVSVFLDGTYRLGKIGGGVYKPGKMWFGDFDIDPQNTPKWKRSPNGQKKILESIIRQRDLLLAHEDQWDLCERMLEEDKSWVADGPVGRELI